MSFDIPEKLYVGVQGKKNFDKTNPPLAFAIPYGTKGWESRKSTVDNWAGYNKRSWQYVYNEDGTYKLAPNGSYEIKYTDPDPNEGGIIVDNELVDGFYFEKSVTRYQTSNKFFRINDPRGFQLEIDSANLGDILLNSHISKGYLVGKFQWTSYKGKAYLVREDHPAKIKKENPKIARLVPNPGDEVVIGENGRYTYLGKFYRGLNLVRTGFKTVENLYSGDSFYYRNRRVSPYYLLSNENLTINSLLGTDIPVHKQTFYKDTKPVHVFVGNNCSLVYRHLPKITEIVSENNDISKYELDKLNLSSLINEYTYRYRSKTYLFKTKQELLDFNLVKTLDELISMYNLKPNYQHIYNKYERYDNGRGQYVEQVLDGPAYELMNVEELDSLTNYNI